MLSLVRFKDSQETFHVYDPEDLKGLSLEDIGLEVISEHATLDPTIPIYPLNDLILRVLIKKKSDSQKLELLGLFTFSTLEAEYYKIQSKTSRLSKSSRDLVTQRYNEICEILQEKDRQNDQTLEFPKRHNHSL